MDDERKNQVKHKVLTVQSGACSIIGGWLLVYSTHIVPLLRNNNVLKFRLHHNVPTVHARSPTISNAFSVV